MDGARLSWQAADETALLELDDHAVDAGRGDAEEALHVGLGWGPAVDEGVGVDEGEVLPLLVSELRLWRGSGHGGGRVIDNS